MNGLKRAALVLGLCLSIGSVAGCGKQDTVVNQESAANVHVDGAGASVTVSLKSDTDYGLQSESDGFCVAMDSGKVTGTVISDLVYNNLMATYYEDDSYNAVSVEGSEGFAYTAKSETSDNASDDKEASDDAVSTNAGMRYHVFCIDEDAGVYVQLSSIAGDDALYQAEDVLVFETTVSSGSSVTDDLDTDVSEDDLQPDVTDDTVVDDAVQ